MSQSEPFTHPLSHQEVAEMIPFMLILITLIWDIRIFTVPPTIGVTFGLHLITQTRWTALFTFSFSFLPPPKPMYDTIWSWFHVRYNLVLVPCTIRSGLGTMYDTIWSWFHVRYDLVLVPCTIRSGLVSVYDINLRATHTKILSIRGVTIPIYLVSSATDSIRQRIVLFKPVPIPTSDPKSEFLCQSSLQLHRTYRPPEHLVRLGYLPRLRHHVSSILS